VSGPQWVPRSELRVMQLSSHGNLPASFLPQRSRTRAKADRSSAPPKGCLHRESGARTERNVTRRHNMQSSPPTDSLRPTRRSSDLARLPRPRSSRFLSPPARPTPPFHGPACQPRVPRQSVRPASVSPSVSQSVPRQSVRQSVSPSRASRSVSRSVLSPRGSRVTWDEGEASHVPRPGPPLRTSMPHTL